MIVVKMLEDKPEDAKVMKEKYDEASEIFDESEDTFEGILYKELEWERLVKRYLPKDKKSKDLGCRRRNRKADTTFSQASVGTI